MERIDGTTMLDDFEARPWKLFSHVRLLARLQRDVNALVAPNWMVTPSTAAPTKRRDDSVLHLDLHPMNVMLTDEGPVIIGLDQCGRRAGRIRRGVVLRRDGHV